MVELAAAVAEGVSSGDGSGIGSWLAAGSGGDMGSWGTEAGGGAGRNGSRANVVGWWWWKYFCSSCGESGECWGDG